MKSLLNYPQTLFKVLVLVAILSPKTCYPIGLFRTSATAAILVAAQHTSNTKLSEKLILAGAALAISATMDILASAITSKIHNREADCDTKTIRKLGLGSLRKSCLSNEWLPIDEETPLSIMLKLGSWAAAAYSYSTLLFH